METSDDPPLAELIGPDLNFKLNVAHELFSEISKTKLLN
jgi:hypothetical protein